MFSLTSATLIGLEAIPVVIETDIAFGLGAFHIVGLPDAAIKESRERIRSSIKNAGLPFPRTRITVNLAPADIKKQGPFFDLPIAISLLLAQGIIPPSSIEKTVIIGELGLNGDVRAVPGALAAASMAKKIGAIAIFIPQENAAEAACIQGMAVFPIPSLKALVSHLSGEKLIPSFLFQEMPEEIISWTTDLSDIKGQHHAKRGLEIAAAGAHNVLLKGPPGTGKTLLARSLPSFLPPLSQEEAIETTTIASVAGLLPSHAGLLKTRPFRSPHHSASAIALVGGGAWPRPGEVSLAHRGVLFLDELPEFSRQALEHLRQPLEDGYVTVARASSSVRFPSRFLLIAAMNPCPCGFADDPKRLCQCSPNARERYARKLSGPLLDRFDLVIHVPNLESKILLDEQGGEPSEQVRRRVCRARKRQQNRFLSLPLVTNADIPPSKFKEFCQINDEGKALLAKALETQHLSARGFARVQKVARTIADLDDSQTILTSHIAEALQYRTIA